MKKIFLILGMVIVTMCACTEDDLFEEMKAVEAQNLVDCDTYDSGCNGGHPYNAY